MGKLSKFLVLAICVTVSVIALFRVFQRGDDTAMYRIFQTSTRGYYFHKFLGIVPNEIYDDYTISVLDSSTNSKLLNITDNKSSTKPNFIVLRHDSHESFVKAYPWVLVENSTSRITNDYYYLSNLINLDSFNLYVRLFNVEGEMAIMKKYCYFISNPNDFGSYSIVNDLSDIEHIIKDRPLDKKNTLIGLGFEIVDLSSLILEKSNGIIYCWFQNHGLVKFYFVFDNAGLIDVKSESLGYLGNEFPSCC
ncbi:hypothetical protein [Algoriphagus chordae]|uniref:Uncharacterized protein n=1 Tax=Algoriphagus chordae TaxID=237019 RepID=A0A2W7T0W6_9BACT|nr:hypothetical protein [Algoriphagus chordae]PZX56802.1 hypothetical protein LV85_00735 [Algoriphagus chordae]